MYKGSIKVLQRSAEARACERQARPRNGAGELRDADGDYSPRKRVTMAWGTWHSRE
jgi:hypothetical protein